jgi:hypothetical protein
LGCSAVIPYNSLTDHETKCTLFNQFSKTNFVEGYLKASQNLSPDYPGLAKKPSIDLVHQISNSTARSEGTQEDIINSTNLS